MENQRVENPNKRIKLEGAANNKSFELDDMPEVLNKSPSTRAQAKTSAQKKEEEKKSLIQIKTSSLPPPPIPSLKRSEQPKILNKVSVQVKNSPSLLNRSPPKILNKRGHDKRMTLSDPIIKTDEDGKIEVVAGIVQNDDDLTPELEAIKNATPVETHIFPCGKCERTFPLKQLLDIHNSIHERERKFGCDLCEKKFFSKYDLGKHALTHSGIKPFECMVCQKSFSRITLLHRHQKIHTDIEKHLCLYCNRQFLTEEELEKHSEKHMKNRPFACTICEKRFAFKQGLERHELVHAKDQPHPCNYCQKSFSTAGKLARHLTAHAGERPYPCKLCTKSFLLSHHLTRHLRSHSSGQGQYKCVDCDKIFHSKDFLIYHSAVHATENLTCPLCKERFDDLDGVTEHIKSHTEGEQYACDYCDLIFTSNEKLDLHCENEHANELCTNRSTEDDDKMEEDEFEKGTVETIDYIISEVDEDMDELVGATEIENAEDDEDGEVIQEHEVYQSVVEILPDPLQLTQPNKAKKVGKPVSIAKIKEEQKDTVATRKPKRSVNTVKNYAELVKIGLHDEGDQDESDPLADIELEDDFNVNDYIKKNRVAEADDDDDNEDDDDDEDYGVKPKRGRGRIQKKAVQSPVAATPSPALKNQAIKKAANAPAATSTPKVETPKKMATSGQKTTQQTITKFLKETPAKKEVKSEASAPPKRDVKEVIRNLPKSVTIVKKEPKEPKEPVESAPQTEVYKIPKKVAANNATATATAKVAVTPKATPDKKNNASTSNTAAEPKSIQPATRKVQNAKPNNTVKAAVTPPTTAKSPADSTTSLEKSKSGMELLKIGNKMVEVKKIPMTKAQIQEMQKEGLIERNGNKLVLKKKPSATVTTATSKQSTSK